MEKFGNKYRIQSARLPKWDYRSNAPYYVTICTAHRENYFGKIENDEMILSEIGKIAEQEWVKTPEIRPDMNLKLDVFVVMPNHFHAIIIIGENGDNLHDDGDNRIDGDNHRRDAMHRVSTYCVSAHCVSTEKTTVTTNTIHCVS